MPRRKPGYPRPTGFVGICEVREGVFRAQIELGRIAGRRKQSTRTFNSLVGARRWRDELEADKFAALPLVTCGVCGRETPHKHPKQRYCSSHCARRAVRERRRQSKKKFVGVEQNIIFNGTTFRVEVGVGSNSLVSDHKTLDEAREQRDKDIRYRESINTKKCPTCGRVFRGKRTYAVYCSSSCGEKARAEGILVRPNGALPSTRRKWREKKKAELEARQQPHVPLQDLIKNKPRPEPVR